MTKEQVIEKVNESLGSLFTKSDVITTLNMVSEEPKVVEVERQSTDFESILNLIKDRIIETINDYDFDDANNFEISNESFEIDYGNTIKLDDFEVSAYEQKKNILDLIKDAFSDLREEHETRMEIVAEDN